MQRHYSYLGDRNTDPELKGMLCRAVLNKDGKCFRGKNGSMLVADDTGKIYVVIGRLLRKVIRPAPAPQTLDKMPAVMVGRMQKMKWKLPGSFRQR